MHAPSYYDKHYRDNDHIEQDLCCPAISLSRYQLAWYAKLYGIHPDARRLVVFFALRSVHGDQPDVQAAARQARHHLSPVPGTQCAVGGGRTNSRLNCRAAVARVEHHYAAGEAARGCLAGNADAKP